MNFCTRALALLGGAMIATALIGCGNDANSAGAPSAVAKANAKRDSYELVSVVRPDSMEQYMKRLRLGYEICVGSAKVRDLPVKPFPAIPAGFVKSRSTLSSDGKSFAVTEIAYGVTNDDDMTPEKGCHARLSSATRTSVVIDNKEYALGADEPGEAPSEPITNTVLPFDEERAAMYAVPRTIKGIALKCLDSKDPVMASGVFSDSCIIDPAVGKIAGADGEPFVVNMRDLASPPFQGGVLVHEAESLKVGIRIDPARFSKTILK